MILKAADIPLWQKVETVRGDFNVFDPVGRLIFANISESDATIACSAGRLLRLVATMTKSNSHPCKIDVVRVLTLSGITVEHE